MSQLLPASFGWEDRARSLAWERDRLWDLLVLLAAEEPVCVSPAGTARCPYCSGSDRTVGRPGTVAYHRTFSTALHVSGTDATGALGAVGHDPDCPWVQARALVGEGPDSVPRAR
jgi:hypothetical protein